MFPTQQEWYARRQCIPCKRKSLQNRAEPKPQVAAYSWVRNRLDPVFCQQISGHSAFPVQHLKRTEHTGKSALRRHNNPRTRRGVPDSRLTRFAIIADYYFCAATSARLRLKSRLRRGSLRSRCARTRLCCHKRFLAKARPEAVFKYRSNSAARTRSLKATAVLIRHGRNFEV